MALITRITVSVTVVTNFRMHGVMHGHAQLQECSLEGLEGVQIQFVSSFQELH
jgi:hypothetical protein